MYVIPTRQAEVFHEKDRKTVRLAVLARGISLGRDEHPRQPVKLFLAA